jgi:predicted O-methyltransferase YrrM
MDKRMDTTAAAAGETQTERGLSGNGIGYFMRYLKNAATVRVIRSWRKAVAPLRRLPLVELESIVQHEVLIEPPIMKDICLPPYHMFDDHDDYTPLMKIVKALQPSVVLELGTAHGNATANICRQSPRTKIYTVNAPVEEQTGELTTYDLTVEEIGRVYREHGFAERVVQIFANTLHLDLSRYFTEPVVELAIIDACHDTEYVVNDFHKVKPYVKPGGIVLFHDTAQSLTPSHLDGSYRACLKLRSEGHDIRQLKNTWWAVWVNEPGPSTTAPPSATQ